ncbi:MAG: 50S ribosomal protein L33 [Alcanivoracaceae bacterium]|nr:50S ribosomal protein L33 [Alcanivoracaceae bacterium]
MIIELKSTESSYAYTTKKNPKYEGGKLEFKKYDPILRKHVLFKEKKISKGK